MTTKVLFLPEVIDYFLELADVLYDKGYFGFEETAIKYARELFQEIENELPRKQKKDAPKYFNRYGKGMYYAVFKRNKNTTWYAFFNLFRYGGEIIYFVRHVSNNHVVAQFL